MSSPSFDHFQKRLKTLFAFVLLFRAQSFGLNTDGVLLLSFKYNILSDPFGVLQSWNDNDETPCSWEGITCGTPGSADAYFRVTGLSLPHSGLLGSIPATLGVIEHLRNLDLSNNSINGSIPSSLFSASELQVIDFSNNLISGELPELVGRLKNLRMLNLSDNALSGSLPKNLTTLRNLTVVTLSNNYFVGSIPGGFNSVRVIDLSSNLINGSLPQDFSGNNLSYLNVSFNRLSGEIPPEFAGEIPGNATLDLSFNNLTGPVPESELFINQDKNSYSGNPGLCGKRLKIICPIPSSAATLPSATVQDSPPAIAAIPKTIGSDPANTSAGGEADGNRNQAKRAGLRPGTILGIVIGDVAGVGIFVALFLYVYQLKKRKALNAAIKKEASESARDFDWASSESSSEERSWLRGWTCLIKHRHTVTGEEESSSESSNTETDHDNTENTFNHEIHGPGHEQKTGALVTVDGEKELELETLLKASAYILGASGSSIMYKAVLEDGTTLAVRRVGENGVERFRDFKNQVRVIAKLMHPNLVRIRGFYWGTDEKLIIYDFVPNGSLANARYRKVGNGSSPSHVSWETRLKIAKGVARGLCYIHEKKHIHGNLKPSNILLGLDMEPKIGDFGLQRFFVGDNSSKAGGSARNFGSKRSTASRDSFQDYASGATPSPSPSVIGVSPYHSPESLRSLKPNTKWDVFSFGVLLLELLTGKVVASDEAGPALAIGAAVVSCDDDKDKVLRMADAAIRGEIEGKEEPFLTLLKLGYNCISPVPQRRPSMKEALQALEKFPSCSISSSYYYGN